MKNTAEEWAERGEHDLEAARLLLDREAHFDTVLFHIHQAVEKHVKGFLLSHGWQLKKIHDLETLITEAMDFDSSLECYLDLGRRLTAFYFMGRYPPGPLPVIDTSEIRRILDAAEQLIVKVRVRPI